MQRIHLSTLAQNDGRATIRLMPYLVRKLYPRADGIAANSKGVADDLAQVIGVPEERIQVIYPSVVTADLFERAQAPVDHPWFCQGQPRIVLGAGNLIKQKDFPTLIRAFAKIRHTHQVRLVILGEGKERPQLSGLIQDLGLEEDVVLLGFVDNPYAYMARAAVFVLSSAWEGFGRVLVEAMAVGTPVVSTNCPSGPAEILEGGKHGPLVPVGDSQALAKAIVNILDNPPSSVVLKGRASDFSLQAVVDSCLEMLQLEDLEVGKV
jgi:glycosyltransferase involved in cell wall biosynthesis